MAGGRRRCKKEEGRRRHSQRRCRRRRSSSPQLARVTSFSFFAFFFFFFFPPCPQRNRRALGRASPTPDWQRAWPMGVRARLLLSLGERRKGRAARSSRQRGVLCRRVGRGWCGGRSRRGAPAGSGPVLAGFYGAAVAEQKRGFTSE